MFAAFLAAFFFALSSVFAHRSTRLVGIFSANLGRLCIATILLGIWAHAFGGGIGGSSFPVFLLSGVIGFGFGDMALFAALPRLGARLTSLMVQCLTPPIAALIEWLWLGTRPSALEVLCGTVILFGVGIAVTPERFPSQVSAPDLPPGGVFPADAIEPGQVAPAQGRVAPAPGLGWGLIFGTVAACGQAGGAVVSRKAHALAHAAHQEIDGGTAAYQRALGGLVVISLGYLISRNLSSPAARAPQWRAAWPWIVANSLAGAAIGVSCYQWALSDTKSAVVLPIVALTPLIVVPFAFLIEHERPSARSLWGGALAVAAAATLARYG